MLVEYYNSNYVNVSTDKEIVCIIEKLIDNNVRTDIIGHINLDSISEGQCIVGRGV